MCVGGKLEEQVKNSDADRPAGKDMAIVPDSKLKNLCAIEWMMSNSIKGQKN